MARERTRAMDGWFAAFFGFAPPAPAAFDPSQATIRGGGDAKAGKGAFGAVTWLDTTQPGIGKLAIKLADNADGKEKLELEDRMYARLAEHEEGQPDHPGRRNFAACHGMRTVKDQSGQAQTGLVIEGIEGRDMEKTVALLDKLRRGDPEALQAAGLDRQLSQAECVGALQYITAQVLTGLAFLESKGLVHNDIRPANVMCDGTTGEVKIVDLGVAREIGTTALVESPWGYGAASPDTLVGQEFVTQAGEKVILPVEQLAVTAKHDMFGAGGAVRQSMEGQQFLYGQDGPERRMSRLDALKYKTPDAAGRARTALKRTREPELLDDRMARLERRIGEILTLPDFAAETEAGQTLTRALADAQARLPDAQTLAEAEDTVRGLETTVARVIKDQSDWALLHARMASLEARVETILDHPDFHHATDAGQTVLRAAREGVARAATPEAAERAVRALAMAVAGAEGEPAPLAQPGTALSQLRDRLAPARPAAPEADPQAAAAARVAARLAEVQRRITDLMDRTDIQDDDAVEELDEAVDEATNTIAAGASPAQAAALLDTLETEISRTEAAEADATDAFARRWKALLDRSAKFAAQPFVMNTPAAQDQARLRQTMARMWETRATLPANLLQASLDQIEQRLDHDEQRVRASGSHAADTDYTRFVNWAMHPDPMLRPTVAEAMQHPFIADRLLDDESARKVLVAILGKKQPTAPANAAPEDAAAPDARPDGAYGGAAEEARPDFAYGGNA